MAHRRPVSYSLCGGSFQCSSLLKTFTNAVGTPRSTLYVIGDMTIYNIIAEP